MNYFKTHTKEHCTGCGACISACKFSAIQMEKDSEGFCYPQIDQTKCVNCGLCEKVCPVIQKRADIERYSQPLVYAAYHTNEAIRMDSTSGGIFSALAEKIFSDGGYVGGAVYNKDHTVKHIVTKEKELLPELRSSKYLQSNTEKLFLDIQELLNAGKKVLVCGAPCQIAGLYNFLKKDYENLISCDFICRGVNSPKVFLKYMEMLEGKYESKATKIKFKNKTFGWHNFSMKVDFANGKTYCKDRWHDMFFVGYLQKGNFSRPSCYNCQFKGFPQCSDITLADFWGIENIDPSMDQDKGTSLVMINSKKGAALFDALGDRIVAKQFKIEQAALENQAMRSSMKSIGNNRDEFFKALDKEPFELVAKKFFPLPTLKNKIKKKLFRITRVLKAFSAVGLSLNTWYLLVYHNFLDSKVETKQRLGFRPLKYSRVQLHKTSKLLIDGSLVIGYKQVASSHKETRLLLEENAQMIVNGNFVMYSDSYIRVVGNGKLTLNSSFINEGVQITCASEITIGNGCAIARDVIIRDYDAHELNTADYKIAKPIEIGDHVWIGNRAMILKGVKIGEGSVVAAGALVVKDVPPNSIVAGVPAKVIKENISWH